MKRFQWSRYAAAGIAGFGLVFLSGTTMAAQPSAAGKAPAPPIADVTLDTGGSLHGQIVDANGAPVAQTTVTIRAAGTDVASAVTDAQGNFSVVGVHGGVVEANAAGGTSVMRVWTPDACPPSANKSATCCPVTRGQSPDGPGYHWPTAELGCHLPNCQVPPPGLICRRPCS